MLRPIDLPTLVCPKCYKPCDEVYYFGGNEVCPSCYSLLIGKPKKLENGMDKSASLLSADY